MKKYYLLVCILLSFSAQAYRIELQIKGMNNSKVYLAYYYGGGAYIADSTVFENEKAVFSQNKPIGEGLYFFYNVNFRFDFLLSQQEMTIQTQAPAFVEKLQFVNNPDAQRYENFRILLTNLQKNYQEIAEKFQKTEDVAQKEELQKKVADLEIKIHEEQQKVIKENPNALSSKMIALMLKPRYQPLKYKVRQAYFDNLDFADTRLLRSPYLFNMIQNYLDYWCEPHPDSIAVAADDVLKKAEKTPEYFQFFLGNIAQRYGDPKSLGEIALFEHFAQKYYLSGKANWIDAEMLDAIRKKLEEVKPKPLKNQTAPDITLLDSAYQIVNLHSIEADQIILYFYDPDCSHCKQTTPKLVELYDKLKKKRNIKVFAVCTSTDIKAWKSYISANMPEWINGIDFAGAGKFLALYNVKNTPKIFVLNDSKTVVAEDIKMEELETFLKK